MLTLKQIKAILLKALGIKKTQKIGLRISYRQGNVIVIGMQDKHRKDVIFSRWAKHRRL